MQPERDPDVQCERCGRCLSVCPVYKAERIETFSPRGRLELIQAVARGGLAPGTRYERSIHSCLQCLACADACPKGVNGAGIIRAEKSVMNSRSAGLSCHLERLGLKMVLNHRLLLSRIAGAAVRSGLAGEHSKGAPPLPPRHLPLVFSLMRTRAGRTLPSLYPLRRLPEWPEVIDPPPGRPVKDEVILFTGCFFGFLDTRPLTAAVRVLGENGIRIRLPRAQTCCGAPALLGGHPGIAEENCRKNLLALDGGLPVLVLCATCGNALKNEYPERFADDPELSEKAEQLSPRVREICEFLAGDFRPGPVPLDVRAAVHTPCHLAHGMKANTGVPELLARIPGLDTQLLEETCCGGGGLCALKNPALSMNLAEEKAAAVKEGGASMVTAPCPGCLIQIRNGLAASGMVAGTVHPVELAAMTWPR